MASTGLAEIFQRIRSDKGLAAEPLDRLAAGILEEFFGGDADTVSRRNAIIEVSQRLGLAGPSRRSAARVLAEAWQYLENRGLICRDPDQTQGEWWFLTRAGRDFLESADNDIALYAAAMDMPNR